MKALKRFVLACFVLGGAVSAAAEVSMDDFAALWLFNEDGRDATENGFHAELNGAQIKDGSLMLDEGKWAEAPSQGAFQAQSGITLIARVFPTDINRDKDFIAHMILAKGNEYLLRIDPPDQGNRFAAFFFLNENWRPNPSAVVPQENVWATVAATYEPTENGADNVKLYIDGELKAEASRPGRVWTTDNPVEMGRWQDFSYFIGAMDEAAVMTKAASAEEIALLHKTGLEAFSLGLGVEPTGSLAVSWGSLKK